MGFLMKSLKTYLLESQQTYQYVIKTVVKLDDEQLDALEDYFKRFELIDISPIEEIKNDFLDFCNNEVPKTVYTIQVTIGTPMSSYDLIQGLYPAINVSENSIIVRYANEAYELAIQDKMFKDDITKKVKSGEVEYEPHLSTSRFYKDEEQPVDSNLYGNEYNNKLLDYLEDVKNTRPSNEVEPSDPLFSWIEMKKVPKNEISQDEADFNKHIDSVKPAYGKISKNPPVDRKYIGDASNLSDSITNNVALLKNKDGKDVSIVKARGRK